MRSFTWFVVTASIVSGAAPLAAQGTSSASQPRSGAAAFGIEAAGGIAGSALGFGLILAVAGDDDCGDELSCILGNVASAVLLGTAGAAGGTYAAGRTFDTQPSGWGAVAGAVVGAAAAIGMDKLLSDETNIVTSHVGHVLVFSLTQGTVAALGSRLGAALR